jgi:two-component system, OmpR family, sensor histidine kinase TctE
VSVQGDGSISVADRGAGVAVENRERIFERFWRGKGGPAKGAGLGLAIVREIVKAHRGTITVEDASGGGAVFTLGFALAG